VDAAEEVTVIREGHHDAPFEARRYWSDATRLRSQEDNELDAQTEHRFLTRIRLCSEPRNARTQRSQRATVACQIRLP
jgi:hypothetical protein